MALKLTNNASSILSAPINTTSETDIFITSGDASEFPLVPAGSGDWFPITVVDATHRENMRCVARESLSPTKLTVLRAQEGSTAWAFPVAANTRVELRLTAGAFLEQTSDASRLTTGTVPPEVLPPYLAPTNTLVDNTMTITASGRYRTDAATQNMPPNFAAQSGYLWADVYDLPPLSANNIYLEWNDIDSNEKWARRKVNGTWDSTWYKIYVNNQLPIGSIIDFPAITAPADWLLCYGQGVDRTNPLYTALDAAIWCGDVSNLNATAMTCFRATTAAGTTRSASGNYLILPDLRGRVVAGRDNMGGTAANRVLLYANSINDLDGTIFGNVGGSYLHQLVDSQMPVHTHSGTTQAGDGGHTHTYNTLGGGAAAAYQWGNGQALVSSTTGGSGAHVHDLSINNAGSDYYHNNMQPTIILNKIIKYR